MWLQVLCQQFIDCFRFCGQDGAYVELLEGSARQTAIPSNVTTVEQHAVRCKISIRGKEMRIAADEDVFLVKFTVTKAPSEMVYSRIAIDKEATGQKPLGCIDLMEIGYGFETPKGRIKPVTLRIYCSERDFLDWKRVLSVKLSVFEENKYSIFRSTERIFQGNRKGM